MKFCWPILVVALVISPQILSAQDAKPTNPVSAEPKTEAEKAYQQGDFAKCIDLTTKAIAANAKDHLAWYLRASARVELGQVQRDLKMVRAGIEDSRESLKAIGKLEPNYYLPYLYGMTTLAQLENRPEHATTAVQIADSLVNKTSITPEQKANIYYQRAVANIVRKQPEDAVKDYQAAIQLSPQHLGARVALAESFVLTGQPEKALEAFTQAIEAFPKNPLVYNNRGMFLQQRGKTKEAYADFSQAVQLDPSFTVAITNRGFTLLNSGQPGAAEADFNSAIKLDPNSPLPHSLRGTSRLAQGKADQALEDYLNVVKLDPQNPTARADVGFSKLFAKDFNGAREAFDQAVKLDGNLRYLVPWRVWSASLAGQADPAANAAESAAKAADKRDWVDHLLLFLAGQETDQQLVEAAKTNDTNLQNAQTCEAYYFIAEKLARAGNAEGAAKEYGQALGTKAINLSAYRGAQYATGQFPK